MADKASPKDTEKPITTKAEPEQVLEEGQASGETVDTDEGWGGWFANTFVSAKEKSNEMFQYLKQDFSEFSDTVQEAGRDLKEKLKLEDTAKTAVTTVGTKMNSILEQVSTIFGVAPDDDDEAVMMSPTGPIVVDRVQAKIYSLTLKDHVFLNDPENIGDYEKWLAGFDLEDKSLEISELMSANPHIQLHYSQLVPDKVSHLVFWHRFYFQIQQIVEAESRASDAAKAKQAETDSTLEAESASSGGEHGMVEISEEDQKRLLAEYEEEMKQGEDGSGRNSRRSSGTQLSSSSSSSFAFVTHDALTDEVRVE